MIENLDFSEYKNLMSYSCCIFRRKNSLGIPDGRLFVIFVLNRESWNIERMKKSSTKVHILPTVYRSYFTEGTISEFGNWISFELRNKKIIEHYYKAFSKWKNVSLTLNGLYLKYHWCLAASFWCISPLKPSFH